MIDAILLALVAGFLIKVADNFADSEKRKSLLRSIIAHASGIAYGAISAVIIILYPILAPLGIAAVLAVLLTEKIDHRVHFLGIGAFVLMLSLSGIPSINVVYLLFFLSGGIIDEIGNDFYDRGRLSGLAATFFKYRMTIIVFTFVLSLITGVWLYFLTISMDIGYVLAERFDKTMKRIK